MLHSTEAAGEEGLGGVKVVTLVKERGREGSEGKGRGRGVKGREGE